MKTNFSFKVIFFVPGNELSNSVEAFLVLFHFITILLQKIYGCAGCAGSVGSAASTGSAGPAVC